MKTLKTKSSQYAGADYIKD